MEPKNYQFVAGMAQVHRFQTDIPAKELHALYAQLTPDEPRKELHLAKRLRNVVETLLASLRKTDTHNAALPERQSVVE